MNPKENRSMDLKKKLCMNTAAWLRTFKGCERYNDTEAHSILATLDRLAAVFLKATAEKIHSIDNQLVVPFQFKKKNQKNAA